MITPDAPHILLLEDDPIHQRVISFNLAQAGFRVALAAESFMAMELTERNHFDLVITDYYLLGELGTDFVKRLREDEEYQHVPVVLLTARAAELNGDRMFDALGTVLVSKGCSMAKLVETVSELLGVAQAS